MKVAPSEAVPIDGTIKFKNVFFNEDVSHEDRTTTFTESTDSAATLHCYSYLITLLLTYQFCPSRTIELVYPTCLA